MHGRCAAGGCLFGGGRFIWVGPQLGAGQHTTWRDVPRADEQGEVCFALDLLSRLITATLLVRQG